MTDNQSLGVLDQLQYVKPGPLSAVDTTPTSVEVAVTNGKTNVIIVLTTEVATKLAKQLAPYVRR